MTGLARNSFFKKNRFLQIIFAVVAACLFFAQPPAVYAQQGIHPAAIGLPVISVDELPGNARKTIQLIRLNGPFPFEKDGTVFGNYERILPKQKRGYYHEYTVLGKNTRDRGAERIVVGGNPQKSDEFYYTADHYATFSRVNFQKR